MAWTAPRTWVTSEVVTAALMNTHVRDNLLETGPALVTTAGDLLQADAANSLVRLAAAWTAFTPTLNQGGAVASSVSYARYWKLAGMVALQFYITATAAGTGGNVIYVNDIPAAIAPQLSGTTPVIGAMRFLDSGTTIYTGVVMAADADSLQFERDQGGNTMGLEGTTLANNDAIMGQCCYEIA